MDRKVNKLLSTALICQSFHSLHIPLSTPNTTSATRLAATAAEAANTGTAYPTIPTYVNVANIPAAGVNPPYIHDWNAAAIEPVTMPAGPKPRHNRSVRMTVKVIDQAMMTW